jgi:hypothetical protein
MKSRLTILAMVAFGMLFSTAGAGLAVSGISTNNASVAQYGTPTPSPSPTPEGGVLPAGEESTPTPAPTNAPEGGVSPAKATQPTAR